MSFDAQSFLDSSVNSSNDTKIVPVPAGEYMGIIEKVLPRPWQSKDGSTSGIALDVYWMVEDENVKTQLDRKEVICKQGLMLDLTSQGELDMAKGKNIGLGRLREAVGKNSPGETFTFSMLPGLSARITVSHRIVGEDIYSEVKGTAKL